jgi:type IV secretory pathway component VirB8
MGHTPPLDKRSDEELQQMLDKGLAVRTLRRVKTILRRRAQNRRQWLFEVAVAALIIAVIAWLAIS